MLRTTALWELLVQASCKTLAFIPILSEMRAPGGICAGDGHDLTLLLRGALWQSC